MNTATIITDTIIEINNDSRIINDTIFANSLDKVLKKIEDINSGANEVGFNDDGDSYMIRLTDSCVHLLGSKQDMVYTTEKQIDENVTEWTMALFDGHGSIREKNPYTEKYEKFNLTLLALEDMMRASVEGTDKKIIDTILEKDIFSEEDPALAMQRALSKVCIDKKHNMDTVGSTMVLVKVRHNSNKHTITIEVLSVGDSTAVIYCNGEKVLETVAHSSLNQEEINRLIKEGRVNPLNPTTNSNSFEILDENTLCPKQGKYVDINMFLLAATQSIGHINYKYGKVLEETGILGLAPYKARLEFSDTDDINIKLFSDGVSDVVDDKTILADKEFMKTSNATKTAKLAKERWEKDWKVCKKTDWEVCRDDIKFKPFNFGKNADDVSCISWIQQKHI